MYGLHVAEDLEAAVGFLSVFALVEAAEFLTLGNAQSHGLLDSVEDEACSTEAGNRVSDHADGLSAEGVVASDIEDTDSERTPHTVHQVNRECADRVIQVQAVEHKDCTDDEHTGDGANNPGRKRGYHVCTGSDGDEACKAAVEGHGGIRLLRYNPARECCGNDTCDSGEVRGHQNPAGCLRVAGEGGTGVESPPTEPQHEHADGSKRNVVGRNCVHLAADILADTRSKNHDASESCPATHGVDERRTGEVMETGLANGRKPAAAPCPATHDGVDEGHVDDGEDEEGVQLHAFGDGARNDGCCGCCEHRLEQPVGEEGEVAVVGGGELGGVCPVTDTESGKSKYTGNRVERSGVHEGKADGGVHRDTYGGNRDVFESDVGRALRADKTRFDTGKAQAHDKHQHGANHDPNVFCHKDGVADGCDLCCCVHWFKSFFS